jgi:hypothetical protein
MQVIFETNIDKYRNKFPKNYKTIPRVGEFVKIENYNSQKHGLPFDDLEVKKITYVDANHVIVELHLSELQHMKNKNNRLNVF